MSPLHPSSRIRNEIRTHYSADVENAITIVSLAVGDGLGAGYTLETFNDTEDAIRVVLDNRRKYLTALEILHKHNIKVGTPSLFTPTEVPDLPLKILMKTPSQRSVQSLETKSYQNSTPSTIQEEYDPGDEFEDVTDNCIVATDYYEMKGMVFL